MMTTPSILIPVLAVLMGRSAAFGQSNSPDCYSDRIVPSTLCEIDEAPSRDGCHRIRQEAMATACVYANPANPQDIRGITYKEENLSGFAAGVQQHVFGIDIAARDLEKLAKQHDGPDNPVRGEKKTIWLSKDVFKDNSSLMNTSGPDRGSRWLTEISQLAGLKRIVCYKKDAQKIEACLVYEGPVIAPSGVSYKGPETAQNFIWISQQEAQARHYSIVDAGLFFDDSQGKRGPSDFRSELDTLREKLVKPILQEQKRAAEAGNAAHAPTKSIATLHALEQQAAAQRQ